MKTLEEMVRKQKMAIGNQRKTYNKPLANKTANKIIYTSKLSTKNECLYLLCGNGHHTLALGAPLNGMKTWLVEQWRRGRVNDLRGKGSQGTHMGNITIGREGVF